MVLGILGGDADGSIAINGGSNWQLSISASPPPAGGSQMTSEMLTPLVELFGGYVYIDRGGNGCFKWYLTKKISLIEYKKNTLKIKRLDLTGKLNLLKNAQNIAPRESLLAKSWDTFMNKWNNYESD